MHHCSGSTIKPRGPCPCLHTGTRRARPDGRPAPAAAPLDRKHCLCARSGLMGVPAARAREAERAGDEDWCRKEVWHHGSGRQTPGGAWQQDDASQGREGGGGERQGAKVKVTSEREPPPLQLQSAKEGDGKVVTLLGKVEPRQLIDRRGNFY